MRCDWGWGYTLCDMGTVVICLHVALLVGGVDVECVQVCADVLHGREVLDGAGAGLEYLAFGRFGGAGEAVGCFGGHFVGADGIENVRGSN